MPLKGRAPSAHAATARRAVLKLGEAIDELRGAPPLERAHRKHGDSARAHAPAELLEALHRAGLIHLVGHHRAREARKAGLRRVGRGRAACVYGDGGALRKSE